MPDLLAHAFIAYSVCQMLSWRYPWISQQYVTLGMVGAFIPDLVKIQLLLPDPVMANLLGVPFDWGSLGTGGGVLLSFLIGVVLLAAAERRTGSLVLAVGAGSHLFADSLLLTPSGRTIQLFWPLSQYKMPSPGLYLSTQPEPTIVAGALATVVWLLHRYRFSSRAAV